MTLILLSCYSNCGSRIQSLANLNPEYPNKYYLSLKTLVKPKFVKQLFSKIAQSPTWKIKAAFEDESEQTELLQDGLILGYQKHRVEIYKEIPQVIQCLKCQGFGHTFYKCNNNPKCLRCRGDHNIKNCQKEKSEKKCANCGGQHISTYKGCPEFLKARQSQTSLSNQKIYSSSKS